VSAHGKRYRAARESIDREEAYTPLVAVRLLKETPAAKFDETVEVHFRLGVNVRHADQQLRGTIMLPHGTGRTARVAVFAQGDKAKEAEEAGADFVGADDLATKIQEGWTDFDVAIATPDMMVVVGRLGRILGPQGKMPNPKVGTVTDDVEKAVTESKAGKVEYRTDRQAIVHMSIGKASLEADKLFENFTAVMEEIVRAKPSAAKGRYIVSCTLTTTMGPGIRVDASKIGDRDAAEAATQAAEELATA
jgi:large subunit ribosomal protein L1